MEIFYNFAKIKTKFLGMREGCVGHEVALPFNAELLKQKKDC